MGLLDSFGQGLAQLGSLSILAACLLGVLVGTMAGLLPGLGSVGAMAVLLPYVFTLDPLPALTILAGIVIGANYGNSTSAILLNIPGDPAAAVTAIDGNAMARAGRPGPALATAAIASTFASLLAIVGVATLTEALAPVALRFGNPEFFALALLGITIVSSLSVGSPLKGYISAAIGLVLTLPGTDPATGVVRYTFGQVELISGLTLVPVAMGIFAIGEVLSSMESPHTSPIIGKLGRLMPTRVELRRSVPSMLRGSLLGFFVGILPGAGPAPASFAAYGLEARVAKRRRLLGSGIPEGVAGPESANNAAAAGSFVPLLTLAIPGSAPTALVLGALIVLGARPGPLFMAQQQDLFWGLIAAMVVATGMLLVLNLPLVPVWASVLRLPYPLLTSLILVLTVTGVFSVRNTLFDVWVAVVLGAVGWILARRGFPLAPLILGFVLGKILEHSFRQSLMLSQGSFVTFVERPVSAVTLGAIALIMLWTSLAPLRRRLFRATAPSTADEHALDDEPPHQENPTDDRH